MTKCVFGVNPKVILDKSNKMLLLSKKAFKAKKQHNHFCPKSTFGGGERQPKHVISII